MIVEVREELKKEIVEEKDIDFPFFVNGEYGFRIYKEDGTEIDLSTAGFGLTIEEDKWEEPLNQKTIKNAYYELTERNKDLIKKFKDAVKKLDEFENSE